MSMRRWRASRISVENRSTTATKLHPRTRPNRSPDLTMKLGVDHIGFQVEDVDAAVARIKNLGGKPLNDRHEVTPADPSKPQSRSEVKCVGPEDQVIDVSNAGWVGAR